MTTELSFSAPLPTASVVGAPTTDGNGNDNGTKAKEWTFPPFAGSVDLNNSENLRSSSMSSDISGERRGGEQNHPNITVIGTKRIFDRTVLQNATTTADELPPPPKRARVVAAAATIQLEQQQQQEHAISNVQQQQQQRNDAKHEGRENKLLHPEKEQNQTPLPDAQPTQSISVENALVIQQHQQAMIQHEQQQQQQQQREHQPGGALVMRQGEPEEPQERLRSLLQSFRPLAASSNDLLDGVLNESIAAESVYIRGDVDNCVFDVQLADWNAYIATNKAGPASERPKGRALTIFGSVKNCKFQIKT